MRNHGFRKLWRYYFTFLLGSQLPEIEAGRSFQHKYERNLQRDIRKNSVNLPKNSIKNDFRRGQNREYAVHAKSQPITWNPTVFSIPILPPQIGRYREVQPEKSGAEKSCWEHTKYLEKSLKNWEKNLRPTWRNPMRRGLLFSKFTL